MRALLLALVTLGLLAAPAFGQTNIPPATAVQQSGQRLDAGIQVQHTHAASTTLTATPPSGQYVYWTGLDISNCVGTAATAAAPVYVTTTGFTGSPQWQVGSGSVAGVCTDSQPTGFAYTSPFKSTTAGTAVTWVSPAFSNTQVVSINVYYYFAP